MASKHVGCDVLITRVQKGCVDTSGKWAVVLEWDKEIGKYKVDFENGFVGWYKRSELLFHYKRG